MPTSCPPQKRHLAHPAPPLVLQPRLHTPPEASAYCALLLPFLDLDLDLVPHRYARCATAAPASRHPPAHAPPAACRPQQQLGEGGRQAACTHPHTPSLPALCRVLPAMTCGVAGLPCRQPTLRERDAELVGPPEGVAPIAPPKALCQLDANLGGGGPSPFVATCRWIARQPRLRCVLRPPAA